MRRKWKWVWLVILLFVLVMLAIPPISSPNLSGVRLRNLSNARQLGLAVRLFAEGHQQTLPAELSEVMPDYVDQTQWESLRFDPREKSNEHPRSKSDWRYFGAFFDAKIPPPLLIASPQFFAGGETNKRIVVLGDLSASTVNEQEYQDLLRATIEAMHERARSLGIESKPNPEPDSSNSEPQ